MTRSVGVSATLPLIAGEITMKGDRLTVVLNGKKVIDQARLPGVPARGPIGLQHHGSRENGVGVAPPAPSSSSGTSSSRRSTEPSRR
jgi:hypothetical protein